MAMSPSCFYPSSGVDRGTEGSTRNGQSFIVGANATQLPYDMQYGGDGAEEAVEGEGEDKLDEESKKKRYWEEHDLSHLDDDPAVTDMLLGPEEIEAHSMLFDIVNPDWKKVKRDMDRRAMVKEEQQEKRRKRKLEECYKMEPLAYIAGKVQKRFRSARTDPDAFLRLTGQLPDQVKPAPSPTVSVKEMKQD